MRLPSLPPRRPALPLERGERLLAWAAIAPAEGEAVDDGPVPSPQSAIGGTRVALYLPHRLPWEQIASADWDADSGLLRVTEVGTFGEVRPVHLRRLTGADRLLQLVRERVTASIAVHRQVAVRDGLSVRIIARRPPTGADEPTWFVEYDAALDPDDPAVAAIVDDALARARADLEV
ncbi:hypothetical protein [Nocardioides sp.]|uniref:hypothetical protein n=1 Tax=Nocardioides sp. TaxID=35761 RepID=UPI0035168358